MNFYRNLESQFKNGTRILSRKPFKRGHVSETLANIFIGLLIFLSQKFFSQTIYFLEALENLKLVNNLFFHEWKS